MPSTSPLSRAENPATPGIVKVRINAAGKRTIGWVQLPQDVHRVSDVLNGLQSFLELQDEFAPETREMIAKEAVSYVEAVEEPPLSERHKQHGTFHPVVVELAAPEVTLEAELFVADHRTPANVLNDTRPFINLRNVKFRGSDEHYGFLAVGKKQIIAVTL